MRLLRVRLTDVRGVASAEARFAPDGVTIVEAPNETGKSTLLEAVDVLLEVKDSSRSQRVKDLQPVDRDVPSTIEVELTCGAYHLTCTKTYHRQTATVLTIHAPVRATLRGDEAHDRLRAILAEEVDPALYAALRYAQGRDLAPVPFGGSNVLAARLDAAAGGAGAVDDGGLLDRAHAEYLRWYTPTGRPGQALQAAARELAEAEQAHGALLQRLEARQSDVDALDRVERQLPELRRRRTEQLEPQLVASRAAIAEVHEARTALAAHRADHVAATTDLAAARGLVAQRDEQAERAARLRREVDAAVAAVAPLRARLAAADREHEERTTALRREREAADRGRQRCDQAQLVVDLLEARAERDRLARRHERVEELSATARAAAAALAAGRLDEAGLQTIRDAARAVQVAEAAQVAGAPSLRLVARRHLEVEVDGEVVALTVGDTLSRTVTERLRVAVPELAELELLAGSSAERLQSAVDAARQQHREVCAAAGVADAEEAEQLVAHQREHQRTLQRCESDLARELDGATAASLHAALTEVQERAGALASRLAGVALPAGGVAAAREAVLTARAEADEAAARAAAAQAAQEEHARDLQALRTQVEVAEAGLAACRQEEERLVQQLAVQRAEDGDDDLGAALAVAEQRELAAARTLAAAEAALQELVPAAVERREAEARLALETLDRDLADLRADQATLRERLRLGGEDGLGERVQQAADRLEQARVDHRRTTRRATAAQLLHSELTRARDEAYLTYRAPLRTLITRSARAVFGASVEVELDEDLCIVGRTLDGVTLPWDQLSAGAREQLAILAGLAAAQLAGRDGVPFVIDDALGYTDPARLERLGAVLDGTADAQVIVLTCVADRFHAVRGARVVQLGDRTTATVTVPAVPPAVTPPAVTPPAMAEPATLPLPLPAAEQAPAATVRSTDPPRGRRRPKEGVGPPRQGRERARAVEGQARERGERPPDTPRTPEAAALTLDLGPH
jgi:hypothetical protein